MGRNLFYFAFALIIFLTFVPLRGDIVEGITAGKRTAAATDSENTGNTDNTENPQNAGTAGDEIYFTILHTNDEHSALFPAPAIDFHPERENPSKGGFARLAGLIHRFRKEKEINNEEVLLVSGGDFYGGTVYGWLTFEGYAPELNLMQQAGYDIVAIGNHEFDNGPDVLAGYLREAGYPGAGEKTVLLATNTIIPRDHPLYEAGIRQTYIKELQNGLKIGFFSIMGNDARGVTVDTGPLEFTNRDETARKAAATLREEEQADLVIAINHAGIDEDRELAQNVSGIDIIVGGHSHTAMHEPEIINDTIIVQAGAHLEYLGVLELAYNTKTGKVRPRNEETGTPNLIPVDHTAPVDPAISALVDKYTGLTDDMIRRITGGRFQSILNPVAVSDFPLPNLPDNEENRLGNFITDAMRLTVEDITGEKVDFAFQGSGIIRSSIIPGATEYSKGKISLYDLMEAVALGSGPDGTAGFPLAAGYLTGDEIRRILEISLLASEHMGTNYFLQVSGLRFTYDPERIILFPIPGVNLPFPSVRAILQAEVYTGEGRQNGNSDDYKSLDWGDKELYHVVTDYVLMSVAVKEAARQLPWLAIEPKDRDGNPVENTEDLIVRADGGEFKVWQSVLYHMAAQPAGESGFPQTDPYYANTAGRITAVSDTGPLTWVQIYLTAFYIFLKPFLIAVPAIIILIVLLRRRGARGKKQETRSKRL